MILLTGVTGKTGGEVARQLAAAGVPFRALIRNPAKAGLLQAMNAELVIGDVADDVALDHALRGVQRALLVMPNGEEQLVLEKRFTDRAVRAGVRHLVKLSSLESVPESSNPITRMHVASERHIRSSGMRWTMIRPTFFMQTFLSSAKAIREQHRIAMPAGAGTIAPTDLRDVAAVIQRVLTEPGHENQSYDLTGPDLITMAEVAARFSAVLGRDISYLDQPLAEFRQRLAGINLAPWRIEAVCKEFEAIAAGAIDHTTGTIARLLGRPPVSLEQFVRDHVELFRVRFAEDTLRTLGLVVLALVALALVVLALPAQPVLAQTLPAQHTLTGELPKPQASGPAVVLVAGATGRTGRLLLEQLRKDPRFAIRPMARDVEAARRNLSADYLWVAGDVTRPATLVPALTGVSLVLVAIGGTERSGPNSPEFVDYGGVKNLTDAAHAVGVRQLVLESSMGVGSGGGLPGRLLNLLSGDALKWKAKGEEYLRASDVPYTIIRPGGLTDDPAGQAGISFRQGDEGSGRIGRGDVAAVMIAALDNPAALRKTFEICNDAGLKPDAWRTGFSALVPDPR